ncbi:MAG: helix-turn-helix transcriptional regulator [Planctomyces sp.]|nr:helix-turn-helix transcriptional regulator [Planctomyces sp.]
MPPPSDSHDIFHAIAEPRRRQIIDLLARNQPVAVGELVDRLQLPQPAVSKHLGVLRRAGIVSVAKQGQHRLYRLEPDNLKPLGDWVKTFERFWGHQLDRIQQRAERLAAQRRAADPASGET